MSEEKKPFVITDRRKFSMDGSPRPDADPSPERESAPPAPPQPVAEEKPVAAPEPAAEEKPAYTGPTAEENDRSRQAYESTSDRLDTAIRAANPGAEHMPPVNFERVIQSIYMTAIMQMGGATPEGEAPRIDILGARQSIDMLGVLAEKTKGNLNADETRLLDSALFELRMAFLEITQALARQAAARSEQAQKAQQEPVPPPGSGRPTIVK
ncbi:MAG: DUF1844 domain-containing protein [Acidobacteriaceae bacterium]|nr:DUF1844 domain-containing protein [Acidobacteriaceae bacterium]